jgi:hypothetical protein
MIKQITAFVDSDGNIYDDEKVAATAELVILSKRLSQLSGHQAVMDMLVQQQTQIVNAIADYKRLHPDTRKDGANERD